MIALRNTLYFLFSLQKGPITALLGCLFFDFHQRVISAKVNQGLSLSLILPFLSDFTFADYKKLNHQIVE